MDYLIASGSGLALGALIAWLKYLILWRPFMRGRTESIGVRSMLSGAVNVVALLAVFWLRDLWPYNFYVTILALAFGLSMGSKFSTNIGVNHLMKEINEPTKQGSEQ